MKKEKVISEEVALNDLELFVNEWVEKPESKDKLAEYYPNMLEALMNGNLVITDNAPVYTLINPIKNINGEVSTSSVSFRTRISPINQAALGKGLNIQNDQLTYALKCICYIVNLSEKEVDQLGKRDYNTVREIASVFM